MNVVCWMVGFILIVNPPCLVPFHLPPPDGRTSAQLGPPAYHWFYNIIIIITTFLRNSADEGPLGPNYLKFYHAHLITTSGNLYFYKGE